MRFIADENFDNYVVRGLLRRKPDVDIVRVQDAGLKGADDATILDWAANENRLLLTHDAATMTHFAYERIRSGERMPGVIEVNKSAAIGVVIEDLVIFIECSLQTEWDYQVVYIPM